MPQDVSHQYPNSTLLDAQTKGKSALEQTIETLILSEKSATFRDHANED